MNLNFKERNKEYARREDPRSFSSKIIWGKLVYKSALNELKKPSKISYPRDNRAIEEKRSYQIFSLPPRCWIPFPPVAEGLGGVDCSSISGT